MWFKFHVSIIQIYSLLHIVLNNFKVSYQCYTSFKLLQSSTAKITLEYFFGGERKKDTKHTYTEYVL